MNKTAINVFYDSIKGILTEEQLKECDKLLAPAVVLERQHLIDFGYRVRAVEDVNEVYSGMICVFKTYPERLYEDYFTQPSKKWMD